MVLALTRHETLQGNRSNIYESPFKEKEGGSDTLKDSNLGSCLSGSQNIPRTSTSLQTGWKKGSDTF